MPGIRLNNFSKLLNLIAFLFLLSCTANEKPQTNLPSAGFEKEGNYKPEVNPVFGTWRDVKDTSHVIVLSEKYWHDYYNDELVSANIVTYLHSPESTTSNPKLQTRNPKLSTRNLITLEESKNNFYHFEIVECDSLRLHLLHLGPEREMVFVRGK